MQVVVGRVGRAHGTSGEVSVDVRTDEPQRRFVAGASMLVGDADPARTLTVQAVRPHSGRLLVRFEQVPDRTAAESLRGKTLSVEVGADEEPEDAEEFYDHQLVGLEARGPDGVVGTVAAVLHLPAQDVLSIKTHEHQEILVPFVAALVPRVDVPGGYLVVQDRPGLLDPGSAQE